MDKLSTNGSMIEQLDLSRVPRSGFDMAFHNYLTGRLGAIIPTAVKEIIPGDRIKGSTHIVTNFEPLASPIMANMIQKEETFFVPYSVIWEKAHRFFTGKKGFDSEMPSINFTDIYNYLYGYDSLITSISNLLDGIVADEHPQFSNLITYLDNFLGQPWITNYQCRDLFKPLEYRYRANVDALIARFGPSIDSESLSANHAEFANLFTPLVKDLIEFYFGPSSILDYLGCGFVDLEQKRSYIGPTATPEDIVHYNLWDFIDMVAQQPEDFNLDDGNIFTLHEFILNGIFQKYFNIPLNWMPVRAAYWIWYWNYRDQLIEANAYDPEENMISSNINYDEINVCLLLRQRCWMKDTFTTALTNTGDGNVIIPTTGATITVLEDKDVNLDYTSDKTGTKNAQNTYKYIEVGGIRYAVPSIYLNTDPNNGYRELDVESGVSLQMLDRARRLSSWLNKRLVLGTEYDDVVYSSFMVKLSNVRMHIPELLSAGRTNVSINVVVNNTNIPDGDVAGNKSAIAYADNIQDLSGVNYFAEEHGLLLSFMTIMPIQSYPAQIQRLYFKRNRFDFAWPEFAQLGMDAVYLSELNGARGLNSQTALTVFGYQGRYYDYKCNQDEEHGRLHTDLNYLTFGRVWTDDELPKLNPEFIHCWPRTDMFVMDENRDLFRSDIHHRWAMERALPVPSDVLR